MTHGFFISMGGFIGKNERPITATDFFYIDTGITSRAIGITIRPGVDISPILSVTKDELMDRSKGDVLSKSISLLQTTWFVVQYFSRVTLSLPTTPLETATLAFALLNFCNYILWWHKPLDVQYPINVSTIDAMMGLMSETLSELPEPTSPRSEVLEPENSVTSAAESKSNPCVRVWRWYRQIFNKIVLPGVSPPDTTNATLPMLWAGQMTWSQNSYAACFGACFGALFGGVHCIEWTSSSFFESSLEHLLWKFSSLLVAIVPVIFVSQIFSISFMFRNRKYIIWIISCLRIAPWIFIFIYICARVYLLVDMFLSLRSLPPGALEEIDWTRYIPHI